MRSQVCKSLDARDLCPMGKVGLTVLPSVAGMEDEIGEARDLNSLNRNRNVGETESCLWLSPYRGIALRRCRGPGGLVFFIDADKACTPMRAPPALLTLMDEVATAKINHEGTGL